MAVEKRTRKEGRKTITTWRVKWRLDGSGAWQSRTLPSERDARLLDATLREHGYRYRSSDSSVVSLALIGAEVLNDEEAVAEAPSVSLAEAIRDYASRTNLSRGTRKKYGNAADALPPGLARTSVAHVDAKALNGWLRSDRDAGVSSSTLAGRAQVLRGTLRAYGRADVAAEVDKVTARRELDPIYLSDAHVAVLVDAAREVCPADYALGVELVVRTGLRRSEVWALTPRSLGPDARTLVVSEAVKTDHKAAEGFRPEDVKDHEAREVPVPKGLSPRLLAMAEGVAPSAPLFKPTTLAWWSSDRHRTQWAHAKARATELDPTFPTEVRFHDLRHTAAKSMLTRGVRVEVVSRILGHASVAFTTAQYWRFTTSDLDHARDLMAG